MQQVPIPGSHVWLRQRRWRVDRAQTERHHIRLDVSHRNTRLTVLTPYDQPRTVAGCRRPVHRRRQRALARLAFLVASAESARLLVTALTARLHIWPHQFEPVLAVRDGCRRVLIADDVGLGKTIQAGLILAELQRRVPGARALVITPAHLRHQWSDELRMRFSIHARHAETHLTGAASPQTGRTNTWQEPGVWLVSLDYLKQPHVRDGLPPEAWDLVVLDEAHMASGRSDRHDVCDELGRRARHFVLLSATPHDGDTTRFTRLLRLGALPPAHDGLVVFRRTRADITLPFGRAVRWIHTRATPGVTRLLDALQDFERVVLGHTRHPTHDAALLLLSVFRKRALSTLAALDHSLARRLEWLDTAAGSERPDWSQPGLDFGTDDLDDGDRASLVGDSGLPRAKERAWLRRLRALISCLPTLEPKLAQLRGYATRTSEPFVLFTEFRHSLERALAVLGPLRTVVVIHGGQPDAVRRQELERFLTGQASVLIATDVGSQGLNLQHRARWVVTLELPWNPARLEQRIGRLDRIGQTRRVHATMLVTGHSAENTLLASLARRTLTARGQLGPSALHGLTPPSSLAMASALLTGAGAPSPPAVALAIEPCARYRRAARAQAVVVTRRRRLLRRWRSPRSPGGRPVRARVAFPVLPKGVGALLVLAAAIVDGNGDVIERRLMAVTTTACARTSREQQGIIDGATPLLAAHVDRRLRRLRAVWETALSRRLSTERAIAVHLETLVHPHEAQLGLFSQRTAVAFDAARSRAALTRSSTAARLRLEDNRGRLVVSAVTIEWIGFRR